MQDDSFLSFQFFFIVLAIKYECFKLELKPDISDGTSDQQYFTPHYEDEKGFLIRASKGKMSRVLAWISTIFADSPSVTF